MSEDIPP
jgi:hypothetical protein